MSADKIKVLVVAYLYPPVGGGYTERIVGYIKYLLRLGCEIYVLSADWEEMPGFPQDYQRFSQVSDVHRVWRVKDYHQERFYRLLDKIKLGALLQKGINFVSCPDRQLWWSKRALSKAEDIVRNHRIDLVFTTSAPYSVHLVGMELKAKLPGLRWVADFRDPMTTHCAYNRLVRLPMWHSKMKRIEKKIYQIADRVILNTPWNREEIIRLFGLAEEKAVCFPNGYDPELLPIPGTRVKKNKFYLLYVGGLRGDWFEGPFYRALAELKCQVPELYDLLEVHFVGVKSLKGKLAQKLGVAEDIKLHGFVEQSELLKFYERADAFLLLLPPQESQTGCMPQKAYGYIYSGKLIFAAIPEGQSAEYIRETESGIVVPADRPDEISRALRGLLESYKDGKNTRLSRSRLAEELVRKLGKPYLVEQMYAMFKKLVGT